VLLSQLPILSAGLERGPIINPFPQVRTHGGLRAYRNPETNPTNCWLPALPAAKRQRLVGHASKRPPLLGPAESKQWTNPGCAPKPPPLPGLAERQNKPNDGPRLTATQVEELGELIARDAKLLDEQGWSKFVTLKRGESDFHPQVGRVKHRAGRLLNHLRQQGASVVLKTPAWSEERLQETLNRGPHKSSHEHSDFLREEFVDFINRSQWVILPLKTLRNHRTVYKLLRISPMGVVPQRNRRPRVIVDYSYFFLNDETNRLAPQDSMQFGKALERILRNIVEADPKFGPVHLIKVDIADGFYRIWLNSHDIPKLAVSIPSFDENEPLVALPLVLPMGWTESPPYFCAATETVADIANQRLQTWTHSAPHRLEKFAESEATPEAIAEIASTLAATATPLPTTVPQRQWKRKFLSRFDLFVDDYVGMQQGSKEHLRHTRRVLLHTLDDVFRPLSPTDSPHRKEAASVKKLLQGDANWATRKLILGWILDTIRMTIELPAHRKLRLQELLDSIAPTQKRITVKKWQQLVGELRSMAIALPGSRGFFSMLQEALRHQSDGRIRLDRRIHDSIKDFRWLLTELSSRPTRLYEIVPQSDPELFGAQDACGLGMGGVWFPNSPHLQQRLQPYLVSDNRLPPNNNQHNNSTPLGPAPVPPCRGRVRSPPIACHQIVIILGAHV
jgi:hypothetical protein